MTIIAALYICNNVLYAILVWHMKNIMVARGIDAVHGAYSAVGFLGRLNGIAFLLYCAYAFGVVTAAGLLVGGLLAGMVVNGLIRAVAGYGGILAAARTAVIGVPVTAVLAWWYAVQAA